MHKIFFTDEQTETDIGLFAKATGVFALYDRTRTRGGEMCLETIFRSPTKDVDEIKRRSAIIEHFRNRHIAFVFDTEQIGAVESYINIRDERTRLSGTDTGFASRIGSLIAMDQQQQLITKGIPALVNLLQRLCEFLESKDLTECLPYHEQRIKSINILGEGHFGPILTSSAKKLTNKQLIDFDSILRFKYFDQVNSLLQDIFFFDAIISVADAANLHNWVTALPLRYCDGDAAVLEVENLKHPLVKDAVSNTIRLGEKQNLLFLTGANMAGKSTLMKSIGLAVYLAHVGVPLAASAMSFTVLDGFYSTINLPDDLGMGASHFYAEVLRLKKIAREINAGKRLFVMFDELFRGTNVKDAEEGTIAIAERFAFNKRSLFVISTHIIEAGEILMKITDGIQYGYMPTIMEGSKPHYPYKIQDGITDDRHGMLIIKNEGLLEMLNRGIENQQNEVLEL
jgi:DNA mismatch repair ATPase MutS